MHIFRHAPVATTTAALVDELDRAGAAGGGEDLLLATARLECAVTDAWSPGEDDCDPGRQRLGALAQAAGAYFLGSGGCPWPRLAPEVLGWLPPPQQRLWLSEPEGLRYYGLEPRHYADAALAWGRTLARPSAAWILGLRTMGSLLGPVVASALAAARVETRCLTLRPRGRPEARRVAATERLRRALAGWRGEFLIVDEGPGLSGSSFSGVVAFLLGLGVSEAQIALLPSWSPDPRRLSCAEAAQGWRRWRIFPAAPLEPPASQGGPAQGLGAGAWRALVPGGDRLPVWAQHERQKYLADQGRTWVKFAGWGGYGRATRRRAHELAAAGWGPPLANDDGEGTPWVRYQHLRGRPPRGRPTRAWAEFAGSYLAWVGSEYGLGPAQPPSVELVEMLVVNLERWGWAAGGPGREPPAGPWVALDGRMLPQEWGETVRGWVKFDATDHGDDPFFPGPGDIAWDLAGVAVELGPAAGADVVEAYCRRSGVAASGLQARLEWHGLAYCAFRAAFCGFAATQVDAPDAGRFEAASRGYRRQLALRLTAAGDGWRRRRTAPRLRGPAPGC